MTESGIQSLLGQAESNTRTYAAAVSMAAVLLLGSNVATASSVQQVIYQTDPAGAVATTSSGFTLPMVYDVDPGAGEVRELLFPDGSVLVISPRSDVTVFESERRISVNSGSVRLTVPANQSPWTIENGEGNRVGPVASSSVAVGVDDTGMTSVLLYGEPVNVDRAGSGPETIAKPGFGVAPGRSEPTNIVASGGDFATGSCSQFTTGGTGSECSEQNALNSQVVADRGDSSDRDSGQFEDQPSGAIPPVPGGTFPTNPVGSRPGDPFDFVALNPSGTSGGQSGDGDGTKPGEILLSQGLEIGFTVSSLSAALEGISGDDTLVISNSLADQNNSIVVSRSRGRTTNRLFSGSQLVVATSNTDSSRLPVVPLSDASGSTGNTDLEYVLGPRSIRLTSRTFGDGGIPSYLTGPTSIENLLSDLEINGDIRSIPLAGPVLLLRGQNEDFFDQLFAADGTTTGLPTESSQPFFSEFTRGVGRSSNRGNGDENEFGFFRLGFDFGVAALAVGFEEYSDQSGPQVEFQNPSFSPLARELDNFFVLEAYSTELGSLGTNSALFDRATFQFAEQTAGELDTENGRLAAVYASLDTLGLTVSLSDLSRTLDDAAIDELFFLAQDIWLSGEATNASIAVLVERVRARIGDGERLTALTESELNVLAGISNVEEVEESLDSFFTSLGNAETTVTAELAWSFVSSLGSEFSDQPGDVAWSTPENAVDTDDSIIGVLNLVRQLRRLAGAGDDESEEVFSIVGSTIERFGVNSNSYQSFLAVGSGDVQFVPAGDSGSRYLFATGDLDARGSDEYASVNQPVIDRFIVARDLADLDRLLLLDGQTSLLSLDTDQRQSRAFFREQTAAGLDLTSTGLLVGTEPGGTAASETSTFFHLDFALSGEGVGQTSTISSAFGQISYSLTQAAGELSDGGTRRNEYDAVLRGFAHGSTRTSGLSVFDTPLRSTSAGGGNPLLERPGYAGYLVIENYDPVSTTSTLSGLTDNLDGTALNGGTERALGTDPAQDLVFAQLGIAAAVGSQSPVTNTSGGSQLSGFTAGLLVNGTTNAAQIFGGGDEGTTGLEISLPSDPSTLSLGGSLSLGGDLPSVVLGTGTDGQSAGDSLYVSPDEFAARSVSDGGSYDPATEEPSFDGVSALTLVSSGFVDGGLDPDWVLTDDTTSDFAQWGFFFGEVIQGQGDTSSQSHVHLGTWVAGDVATASELPSGSASYQGRVLGEAISDGDAYLANGTFIKEWNFGVRRGTFSLDFDNASYSGETGMAANGSTYAGALTEVGGSRDGGVVGSFVRSGADATAGTIGRFFVGSDETYQASGVFVGAKSGSGD